ncbi:MAG: hypothetical protein R3F40_09425 [Candidatus Competibacteraceae bacterium]
MAVAARWMIHAGKTDVARLTGRFDRVGYVRFTMTGTVPEVFDAKRFAVAARYDLDDFAGPPPRISIISSPCS